MAALDFITKNAMLKNLAFGKLKDAINENGITLITVSLDEKGELKFNTYNEPVEVIATTDLQTLKTLATQ